MVGRAVKSHARVFQHRLHSITQSFLSFQIPSGHNHHSGHSISFCPLLPVMAITLFLLSRIEILQAPLHVRPHTRALMGEPHSPWTCVLLFAWLADSYCSSGLVNAGVRKQTIVYHCAHTRRSVFITVRTSEMWAHWGLAACFLRLSLLIEWW